MRILNVKWDILKLFCDIKKYGAIYYIKGDFIIILSYMIGGNKEPIFYRVCIFNKEDDENYIDFKKNYLSKCIDVKNFDEAKIYLNMMSIGRIPYNKTLLELIIKYGLGTSNINWYDAENPNLYDGYWVELYGAYNYGKDNYPDLDIEDPYEDIDKFDPLDTEEYGYDNFKEYKSLEKCFPSLLEVGEIHTHIIPVDEMYFHYESGDKLIKKYLKDKQIAPFGRAFCAFRFAFVKNKDISIKPTNWVAFRTAFGDSW